MKRILLTIVLLYGSIPVFSQCFAENRAYTFDYNGHTYKIIKENKTWTEAVNCAVSTNGYLAEIKDQDEENAIFSALTNDAGIDETFTQNEFGTAAVWIGGSDSQEEGVWIWDGDNDGKGPQFWNGDFNGSTVNGSYANWGLYPTEPDDSGGQDKLTLTIDSNHSNYGKWNDLADLSYNRLYYVIEYDSILAVTENILKNKINIYPNPFKDLVVIESPMKIAGIDVYNPTGQQIFIKKDYSNIIKIDLSYLERGIYYLKITMKEGSVLNYKLVK